MRKSGYHFKSLNDITTEVNQAAEDEIIRSQKEKLLKDRLLKLVKLQKLKGKNIEQIYKGLSSFEKKILFENIQDDILDSDGNSSEDENKLYFEKQMLLMK